jgi:hypothetical protein
MRNTFGAPLGAQSFKGAGNATPDHVALFGVEATSSRNEPGYHTDGSVSLWVAVGECDFDASKIRIEHLLGLDACYPASVRHFHPA